MCLSSLDILTAVIAKQLPNTVMKITIHRKHVTKATLYVVGFGAIDTCRGMVIAKVPVCTLYVESVVLANGISASLNISMTRGSSLYLIYMAVPEVAHIPPQIMSLWLL